MQLYVLELQQIFDLFGYSLEFWYLDLHLVLVYMHGIYVVCNKNYPACCIFNGTW